MTIIATYIMKARNIYPSLAPADITIDIFLLLTKQEI